MILHVFLFGRLLICLVVASVLSASYLWSNLTFDSSFNDGEVETTVNFPTPAVRQSALRTNTSTSIGPAISCGRKKCLHPVKTNKTQDNLGYLISQPENAAEDSRSYQRAFDAWRYSRYLEHHYNFRQTLLTRPVVMNISNEVASSMNGQNSQGNNSDRNGHMRYKNTTRQYHAGSIVVQPVHIVPKPWLLIGCFGRYIKANRNLQRFLQQIAKNKAKEEFKSNFRRDLNQTFAILQESEVECLYHDFQVILDKNGNLHHMDLDRCNAQVRRNDGKGKIKKKDKQACQSEMYKLALSAERLWDVALIPNST